MTGRLHDQVAVITGGASGVGRDMVLRFLAEGAQVVLGDLNQTTAEETLDLAQQQGHPPAAIRFLRCDVSHEADMEALVRLAIDSFGRLDCMINNAGVVGAIGPLTETAVEDWDRTQAILLRATFLGIKHAARFMKRARSGCILSTASVAGLGGGGGPHAYSAAKAGVVNLTRTAAAELAEWNIRVNAIAPGLIVTPLVNAFGDLGDRASGAQPLARAGRGTDVAAMAAFLASSDASFCTGQTYVVDGGLLARGPGLRRDRGESSEERPLSARFAGMSMGNTGEAWNLRELEDD